MAIPTDVTTIPSNRRMFDALLEVRDSSEGANTTIAANRGTLSEEMPLVGATVTPINVGNGRMKGRMIIQLLANADVVTGNEIYDFIVYGNSLANVTAGGSNQKVELGRISISAAGALMGENADEPELGDEYSIYFSNDVQGIDSAGSAKIGRVFPFITLGLQCYGTTPSVDYIAYIAPDPV